VSVRSFLPRPLGLASPRRVAITASAIVLLAAALLVAGPYLRFLESHESTDDAYVNGSTATVTSRVTGTVVAVDVAENWSVEPGEVLIRLDPRDFQVKLDQAQAQRARARQTVDELHAAYSAAASTLALSQEKLHQAELDFERARELRAAGVASQEAEDRATTALGVARANRDLATHQLSQGRAALGAPPDAADPYDTPLVHEAEAAVEAAKLDLGYTVITAPISGSVVDKHVEVGDRVQQGQPVMTLVPPPSDLYVTANFKETQLKDVRVGQKAEIRPDIYPGTVFHAHVDSLSMGTGAAFALLPPENATGNWVKVVQRLPVRLVLDQPPPPDKPLRMGLSVEAVVDVSDTRGPVLASLGQERWRIVPAKNPPDARGTASAAACALRVDSIHVCGATPSFALDDRRAAP
jgi:membrane fusion protein, multidrug efflux system